MARLYFAEKGSKQWQRIKEVAALTFNQSNLNGAFYFYLIDLERKIPEWSQEIYLDFKYNRDKEYFHSFEGDKGIFGILFADTDEADKFYEILMEELESYTAVEKMPSKGKTKSKSIFGAFGFGRRSAKTEETVESSSEEKIENQKTKKKKEKQKEKDSELGHDDVSEPRDFTHLSHIGFNPTKGTFDIQNIPDEWKNMFAKAGITQDQLENRSTAKFIAGFVQDSEPQMKQMMSKRVMGSKPPAPVPLKKKTAPPPPPPLTPSKGKKSVPLPNPAKSSSAVPPPPPPKKITNKAKATNNSLPPPPPPPPQQQQSQTSLDSSQIPKPPSAHSALFESIKGAGIGILKPINTSNESCPANQASSADPHSALMASIKGGASLRPASKLDRSPSSPTSSVASTDPTDMMAAMLAKALAARNKKLAADSSDEEHNSDDSRW